MISKIRMLTEKAYADGVADATTEMLGILRTALMYTDPEDTVNAVLAFVVGTETVLRTGSADRATEAFDQVRNLSE